ncbi:MAG: thioesterase family protein [Zavarzinella sp.]
MSIEEELGFPIVKPQVVDWADMDVFGHINNVVYFRYFENIRIEYFRRLGWMQGSPGVGIGPIVHSTQARFRTAVHFPATLLACAKVKELNGDRFTVSHQLVDSETKAVTTYGEALIVCYDYTTQQKCRIPDELELAIMNLEAQVGNRPVIHSPPL